MSPPPRNWSTIPSFSDRIARTDIARPDWKKTSSAEAGAAAVIDSSDADRMSRRDIEVQL
jgi:hypothetical protein